MKRDYRALLITAFFGISLMMAALDAHAQAPKYKEGDRVEFDVLQTGDPARAQWKKATIIQVQVVRLSSTQTQTNYVVRLDPVPGRLPQTFTVSQRLAEQGMTYSGDPSRSTGFIRPLGGAAPQIETDKLRVDANGTVLADREVLECQKLRTGPARNGPPLPAELAKKLIRCLFEAPSAPGKDGATTVDITEFTPGSSHRWDRYVDRGSGATINTIVYTFRVKFNQTSFYHEHNDAHIGVERIFSCYVDEDAHGWYCGQYKSLKDGERKMIPVHK